MLFSEFIPAYHPYRQLVPFFQRNRTIPLAVIALMRIFEQLSCLSLEASQAKLAWWQQELTHIWHTENYKAVHPISIELQKINSVTQQHFISEKFRIFIEQTQQHIERIRYENEDELIKFWQGFYGFFLGLLKLIQDAKNSRKWQHHHTDLNIQAMNFGLLHLLTSISQTLSLQRFDIPLNYLSEIHCPASVLLQRQNTHALWQKISQKIEQKIIFNLIHQNKGYCQNHEKKMLKCWLHALKNANFQCLNQQIYPKISISLFTN